MTTEQALSALAESEAEGARLRDALKFYADPKNWWTRDVGGRGWHNTNLHGSMERMASQIGTHQPRISHFHVDCGDVARAALSPHPKGDE